MDPFQFIWLLLLLIAGGIIWFIISQGRRQKQFQAKLEQMPEEERQAILAAQEDKKKWGCLSAFLALALVGNIALAILSYLPPVDISSVFGGLFYLFGAVCAGVIYWSRKKWAVYGYIVLMVVIMLINLVNGTGLDSLRGVVPILLLTIAVRPVWDQLE